MADCFIKKWLHIPPSGTLAVIHAPEGLNIKSLSHLYKEVHAVAHSTSRLKADQAVNTALTSRISRESQWTHKGSITAYSEEQFVAAQAETSPQQNTRRNVESVKAKVKLNIAEEFHEMWTKHIKTLTVQGRFLEILSMEESHITWRSLIYNLPRGILQFAVNSTIDTLATNANLKRWGKRTNAKCDLCGQRETLHHVLNNCQYMLDRYAWRHNSILHYIYGHFTVQCSQQVSIYMDIPGLHDGISTIPADILVTNLKPDLIIVNRPEKTITLFELSVPFETNISNTHARKVDRYKNLIADIEERKYKVQYFPVEIGSRGYIDKENCQRLKCMLHKLKVGLKFTSIKGDLSKIALLGSYIVYHSKYDEIWLEPRPICLK